ncbi:hypothetical protein Q7C36_007443 [Tachysurus vachellii]|uniref:Uncharacterized protein n=1 Tax=Tachysurus vachellii TaxID=175792 RepID=A0AA88T321_TACVA|nr:hypothetical protein Q7C36_007443 [Tachysurus vachellii]
MLRWSSQAAAYFLSDERMRTNECTFLSILSVEALLSHYHPTLLTNSARFRQDAVVPKRQVQSACRARRVSCDSGCCEGATVNKGTATGAPDAAEGKATASRACAVQKAPRCVLVVTWPDSTGNEGTRSRKRRSLGSLTDTGTVRLLAEKVVS